MTQQVLAPSTRNPRLPGGCPHSDIFRRVRVAVVPDSAVRARPISNRQRHFRLVRPATRTGLATRKPAVHHDHGSPVPRGFVFDLAAKLAHAHVGDSAGQTVILDHARHVQIFEGDDIGAFHYRSRGLVQEVGAHRRNVGVNPGHLDPLLVPPVAALGHSRQPPLLALQVLQSALEMAGIARLHGLFAVPTHHHVLNSQIQTDRFSGQRQRLDFHLAGEAHEIPSAGVSTDRRHFRDARRHLRPAHLDRAELGQLQEFAGLIGAVDLALVELITDGLLAVARLEAGIAGLLAGFDPAEKMLKRLVLIDQGLRQAGGHAIGQPREFPVLPLRDQPVQRHVVMTGLVRLVGFLAQVQAAVPDEPVITELNRQLLALGSIGINSELVGFESCYHMAIVTQHKAYSNGKDSAQRSYRSRTSGYADSTGKRRKSPALESGGNGLETIRNWGETRTEEPARISVENRRTGCSGQNREREMRCGSESLRKPFYDRRGRHPSMDSFNADAGGGIKPNQQQPQLTGDEIMMKVDGMSDRLECWRWK